VRDEKGYPRVTGIPLPELEHLSSERYGTMWILGQQESVDGGEMLDTPQIPLPRPWVKMREQHPMQKY